MTMHKPTRSDRISGVLGTAAWSAVTVWVATVRGLELSWRVPFVVVGLLGTTSFVLQFFGLTWRDLGQIVAGRRGDRPREGPPDT
jgi:hypothetical protein